MKNALAYEWLRVRSLRSTWLLLTAAAVLQFASGLYWGLKRDLGTLNAFTSSFGLVARVGALLVAAVGVCAFSLDDQHGTRATTRLVLRTPARIVAARAVVIGGLGLLGGALMVLLSAAGVLAGGGALPSEAATWGTAVAGVLLLTVLSGLVGVALGALLRHTAAAVGVLAVWALMAESVVAALLRVPLSVLPISGTAGLPAGGGGQGWLAPLVFAALAVAGLAAAHVTLMRRDA
ncbi:hypothetical protein [Prauserella cavernicola]|uniref:Uncharacterized protein n=1 Tax=Prauserella cavernicola TaxID=2800127 RepID=A0A934QLW8_9PSEU|nr:hypothetical protein [Prauserella cavernicola]MBK1783742.1 hypothetical protein [Prauserella cavernicola]